MKKGLRKAKWRPLTARLYDKAWALMSEIVRRVSKGICFTCDTRGRWEDMDCGHFVHGRKDLDKKWYRGQCKRCNNWLGGNLGIYATKLIECYGLQEVKEYQKYHPPIKWKVAELQAIIAKYQKLISEIP